MPMAQKPKEGVGSLGSGGCEGPFVLPESNLGFLEEEPMLSTCEPSHQTHTNVFEYIYIYRNCSCTDPNVSYVTL